MNASMEPWEPFLLFTAFPLQGGYCPHLWQKRVEGPADVVVPRSFARLVANLWICSKQLVAATSVFQMGPNQRAIKGGKRGHGYFSERPPYYKLHTYCLGCSLSAVDGG